MTATRLLAIFIIFLGASFAWVVLGGSVEIRTVEAEGRGYEQVGALWGEPQTQEAPRFSTGDGRVDIASSDITADFELDQRKRGLLWYATYAVDFDAEYGLRNDSTEEMPVTMVMPFPSADGVYDGFGVEVDGVRTPVEYREGEAVARFEVPAGSSAAVRTGYRTQGQDEWRYAPTPGVEVIDDFSLTMTTDFDDVDFAEESVSPTFKEQTGDGWVLEWEYDSLVSGKPVALVMPTPLNPGPVAARISFFAPVSLLFYFAALILLAATRNVNIHPVNFGFLAAGFFAFQLLFTYLLDHIDIAAAFAVAAAVSMLLCVGYLSLVLKDRRALAEAAVAQLVFLVLFSFTFFFEGYTGLAITIGAVMTLAYFMFRTARTDWGAVFERGAEDRRRRAAERTRWTPQMPTAPTRTPGG